MVKHRVEREELQKLLDRIAKTHKKLLKAECEHKLKKVEKHEFKLLCLLLDLNKITKEV